MLRGDCRTVRLKGKKRVTSRDWELGGVATTTLEQVTWFGELKKNEQTKYHANNKSYQKMGMSVKIRVFLKELSGFHWKKHIIR